MRIHGIQLRGLTAPTGDHQLALDPGYTVLRVPDPDAARQLLAVTRALLHPESMRATELDSRGRAVLTLALRSDGCLVAADFARGRVSLGRLEANGGASKALSSDPREIEAQLRAFGLPGADEFDWLHVFGAGGSTANSPGDANRPSPAPPASEPPKLAPTREETAARVEAERARLLAEHDRRVSDLASERARLEETLGAALRSAAVDRVRDDARLRELRVWEEESTALEREIGASLAEREKYAAMADSVEDFDTRLAAFRTLVAGHDEDRAIVEDTRVDLLADRARLRLAPPRLRVPIALGIALGIAGAAAGTVGYRIGYGFALVGILALLVALVTSRIVRARLGRIETLLAVLRVRERTSERRFESEGAQVRGIMLALGVDSPEDLRDAARGFAEKFERAEQQKRRLAELAELYPPELRAERARLEQTLVDGEVDAAVSAARSALLTCPTEVPAPTLPDASGAPVWEQPVTDADTAVDLGEKPDEESQAAPEGVGPEALIAAASRVLDRSEAELRARLSPVLPVYLRALSMGTFTNARAAAGGTWILRGAAREEQSFEELSERDRALVRLAVQLALLEALAGDRRIPLLIGPDLPSRSDAEQRALARAFKRLASIVQVVQVVTVSAPWAEHAGKSFEL